MYQWNERQPLDRLLAPRRNNYYYGKLLDEFHLVMEQNYFVRKRWLLNRLGLGAGVLCGLEIRLDVDGKTIWVMPGMAINSLGQEIIVPEPVPLDPTQLTDECGAPAHDVDRRQDSLVVTICIAYRECYADYSPVLISDCDDRGNCAPGTIVEGYCLLVRQGQPEPFTTDDEVCQVLSEASSQDNGYHDLFEVLSRTCAVPPGDLCIPLAVIKLPAEPDGKINEKEDIDAYTYRPMIFSNQKLFELILCLSDRIEDCCGGEPPTTPTHKYIEVAGGNGQQIFVGGQVTNLQARVMQGNAQVTTSEQVTFRIMDAGDQIGDTTLGNSYVAPTIDGIATLPVFKLGLAPGYHQVSASIVSGAPAECTFFAIAVETPVKELILKPRSSLQQRGMADAQVTEPPVVQVFRGGVLQDGVPVTFDVLEGGPISDDPVSPPITSVTTVTIESGKQGITGEVTLPGWTLGVKDNRVQAHIVTPDLPRECIFYAYGVEQPYTDEFLQIVRVELLNVDGTVRYALAKPGDAPQLPELDPATGLRMNQIRVTFNRELDPGTLTPVAGGGVPDPDVCSFLVMQLDPAPAHVFPGVVSLPTANVALFFGGQERDPSLFREGIYTVKLFGSPNPDPSAPPRVIIQSTAGLVLDGDLPPFWSPGKPLSGNGNPGGNFDFKFEIIP